MKKKLTRAEETVRRINNPTQREASDELKMNRRVERAKVKLAKKIK